MDRVGARAAEAVHLDRPGPGPEPGRGKRKQLSHRFTGGLEEDKGTDCTA